MALEMKTHKDIAAYEAKPMFGLTWRQIAALAIMLSGGGVVFFGLTAIVLSLSGTTLVDAVSAQLHTNGTVDGDSDALRRATSLAMVPTLLAMAPVALWAWVRPMGLHAETYAQFFFRHNLSVKVIHYDDTYSVLPSAEPVPAGSDAAPHEPKRQAHRQRPRPAKRLSEHAASSAK